MGAGIVHKQVSKMDLAVQKAFYGCAGPHLRIPAFAGFVQAVPVPARREDAILIESGGNLAVGCAVPPHGKGPAHHCGGVFVDDQFVLIVLAFAIAIRSVSRKKLPAFHFGVSHGFNLVA